MKGGLVVNAVLFSFIFLFRDSHAKQVEFEVDDAFVDLGDPVEIKLEAMSSIREASVAESEGSPRGKLRWKEDSLHLAPETKFTCSVYVVLKKEEGMEALLLGSFVAFDGKWVKSSWKSREIFRWSVGPEGAALLSSPLKRQIRHSWNSLILIILVKNLFSTHEPIVVSIQERRIVPFPDPSDPTTRTPIVPGQYEVQYEQVFLQTRKIEANPEHLKFTCSVRRKGEHGGAYGEFEIFDSSSSSGGNSGVRKLEFHVREGEAEDVHARKTYLLPLVYPSPSP